MKPTTLSQWRTVLAVLSLGLLLVVSLLICAQLPEHMAIEMYGVAAWSIVGLAIVVGGKSAAQHLAAGGGIKGAVAALFTDAKPGEPKA